MQTCRFPLALPLCASLSAAASGQSAPSLVDYTPELPPTASYPVFHNAAASIGTLGTDFANPGSGRGQCIVDLLGPDPLDPLNPGKVGPPDGIADIVQVNSNSPALPLGAPKGSQIVPSVGALTWASLLFRGEPDGKFTDVAAAASIHDPGGFNAAYPGGSPWAVVALDMESDGDSDLFYANGGFNLTSPNTLLENLGDGTMSNVTLVSGVTHIQDSFSVNALDYDLDGDVDLYVGNGVEVFSVYIGAPNPDPTNRLYQNDGSGLFIDVGAAAGVDLRGTTFSTATADLDRNGWPDIAVSCFMQYNKVFYNKGDGTFSLMAPPQTPGYVIPLATLAPDPEFPGTYEFPGVPASYESLLPLLGERSMPVDIADMNGDTWPDVLFSSWCSQVPDAVDGAEGAAFQPDDRFRLYLNRGDQDGDGLGDGLYREASVELGISHVGGAMGLLVGDVNGDSFPDVYVGSGGPNVPEQYEEDYLYVSEPTAWPADFQRNPDQPLTKAYWEVGALAGTYPNMLMAHGANVLPRGDRLDLVIGNGGPAAFDLGQPNVYWENLGNADGVPYNLTLARAVATRSAPGGLGARIDLIRDAQGGAQQTMSAEVTAGSRFGSHRAIGIPFGLGQGGLLYGGARWPSGASVGRILWVLDPKPDELVFTEPELSLAVDASYPAGGGVTLTAKLKQFGSTVAVTGLTFGILTSGAGGVYQPTFVLPLGVVSVGPGEELVFSGTITDPPQGIYALLAHDPASGTIHNAGAVWHEAALEAPLVAPAPPAAPWTQAASQPRPRMAWSKLAIATDTLEISPAFLPYAFERWEPMPGETRRLDSGDLLSYGADGVLTIELARPALAEVGPEGLLVTTRFTAACCERSDEIQGSALRFGHGARLVSIDDHP